MPGMRKLIKDPLVHFMAAGVAVFVLFDVLSPEGAGLGDRVIVVDEDALLTHIQYRTRTFEPEIAQKRLAALSPMELQTTVRDYVREEALHREAMAMGMDANDYIIKRRLIQKVEFLAQGFADASVNINDDDLVAYYDENRDDYFVEPKVTFTHVFFDAEERGRKAALTAAAHELEELNGSRVPFSEAGRYGDRFVYHLNYVDRTLDLVASHFGPELAREVFSTEAGDGIWRGPYESEYGSHLVLVSRTSPGRYPEIEEIQQRLTVDATSALARERLDAAIDEIVASYDVRQVYEADSSVSAGGFSTASSN